MKTWCVVCGAIRDELELILVLKKLVKMRDHGVIEGIILSTWSNDIDKFNSLRDKIIAQNIKIIEIDSIENRVEINRTNSINYMRQAMQFQAALDILPNDVFILKCRTDRALEHLNKIEKYINNDPNKIDYKDNIIDINVNIPKIFDYPITILNPKTQRILHFSDFVFWGHISDVRKLLNFDISELFLNRDLVANTQWFVYPFLKNFPIIRDYFRIINFRPLISSMNDYLNNSHEIMPLPNFFYRVYGTYLLILNKYFRVINNLNTTIDSDSNKFHFSHLFHSNEASGTKYTKLGVLLQNDSVIEGFLNINASSDDSMDLLFLNNIMSEKLFDPITNDEFKELKEFRDKKIWFDNNHWIREKNWNEKIFNQENISDQSLLDYRFEDLSEEENKELMVNLESANNIDKYLFHYWLNNEMLGLKSAEQMIFPYSRTRNREPLIFMSRLMRLDKAKNIEEIKSLIRVVYDVNKKRDDILIKDCLLMINLILTEIDNFSSFYDNNFSIEIFKRYFDEDIVSNIFNNKYCKEDLIKFLNDLSV
ncbi:hypothetical protein, partial [Floricoccus tropicus]|uniref:hypothetical protein n=1 Tax=Floricoccus tropicus TaxID=1859473 RepID=UPI0009498B00